MGKDSSIEWCDHTWPVTTGCNDASPGCLNCYSKVASYRMGLNPNPKIAAAYGGTVEKRAGVLRWTGLLRPLPDRLDWPLKWKKPARIFVGNMSDLFHPDVPDEFIDEVFAVMLACAVFENYDHTFQVLTKRAVRMAEYLASRSPADHLRAWAKAGGGGWIQTHSEDVCFREIIEATTSAVWGPDSSAVPGTFGDSYSQCGRLFPLPNVWLGVSVEDQKRADERIPHLLRCPAAVRFLSVEPMLERISLAPPAPESFQTLSRFYGSDGFDGTGQQPRVERMNYFPKIHWVICGGESGPRARPFDLAWARDLRDQCKAADVTFFMKQMGSNPFIQLYDHQYDPPRPAGGMYLKYRDSHGGDESEFPDDLKGCRAFPRSEAAASRVLRWAQSRYGQEGL